VNPYLADIHVAIREPINTIEDRNAEMQTCQILISKNDINWNQLDNIMTCQHSRFLCFEGKRRGSSCKFEWGRPDLGRKPFWEILDDVVALHFASMLFCGWFDMTRLFLGTVKRFFSHSEG